MQKHKKHMVHPDICTVPDNFTRGLANEYIVLLSSEKRGNVSV